MAFWITWPSAFVRCFMNGKCDNVHAMRKEMESAIESASNGLYDSTSWWDSYYTQIYGKPLIEKLLDDLEHVMPRI